MDTDNKIKILLKKLRSKIDESNSRLSWSISYSGGKRKTNKRMYVKVNVNRRIIFGRFPLNKSDKKVNEEFNILRRISVSYFTVPKTILKINNGFFMSVVKGNPIEVILRKQGLSKTIKKILKRAVTLIALFHQATEVNHVSLRKKVNIYFKITGQSLRNFQIKDLLREISVGYMHGDLDPFNMFFHKKDNSYGLIDWEDFIKEGLQELDILHFLIMTAVILHPNANFNNLYQRIFLQNTLLNRTIMKLLKEYCTSRKKNPYKIINLLPIYCDAQIYRLIKSGRNPNSFLYKTFKNMFQENGFKIY